MLNDTCQTRSKNHCQSGLLKEIETNEKQDSLSKWFTKGNRNKQSTKEPSKLDRIMKNL